MSAVDRARTRIYGNRATLEKARSAVGVTLDLEGLGADLPIEGGPLPGGRHQSPLGEKGRFGSEDDEQVVRDGPRAAVVRQRNAVMVRAAM